MDSDDSFKCNLKWFGQLRQKAQFLKKVNAYRGFPKNDHFQLEDLLVDNQQFDSKRREVEAWLGRMEAWLARMRPVGMTADVLEAQIREQKVNKREKFVFWTGNS